MSHFEVFCESCHAVAAANLTRCKVCSGSLSFRYDEDDVRWDETKRGQWRYRAMLPVADPANIVSLGEGGTPLLASRLRPNVWYKDETRNPTGSFKDRPLSVALSHATELQKRVSVVVSAGSTGISNAAMSTRAGIPSVVMVPEGAPAERLHPIQELGARVVVVKNDIDSAVSRLAELSREIDGVYDSSTARSSNPYQSEGAKTIAYEIVEDLGVPDWVVIPLGGGGVSSAIWRGFRDLLRLGRIDKLPKILGVVPEHYSTFAEALESDVEDPGDVVDSSLNRPDTVLIKIAHVYPPDGVDGLAALRDSRGAVLPISDRDALDAQGRFGREEGIFIEPSSAAGVAGFDDALAKDIISPDDTVVVLLSGSGFRESFLSLIDRPLDALTIGLGDMDTMLQAAVRDD